MKGMLLEHLGTRNHSLLIHSGTLNPEKKPELVNECLEKTMKESASKQPCEMS